MAFMDIFVFYIIILCALHIIMAMDKVYIFSEVKRFLFFSRPLTVLYIVNAHSKCID